MRVPAPDGASGQDPITATCPKCGVSLVIGKNLRDQAMHRCGSEFLNMFAYDQADQKAAPSEPVESRPEVVIKPGHARVMEGHLRQGTSGAG